MMKILFLLLFVNCVFGVEILCRRNLEFPDHCEITFGQTIIQVSTENEEVTLTGNPVNGFEGISRVFFGLPHKIHFIPTRMFETMKNLEYFEVNQVEFTTMTTEAFKNCLRMKGLYVNENNFPVVPERFAETCSATTELLLISNHIKTIHKDALKGLANLVTVSFMDNEITTLDPLTFTHTPNLREIGLQSNSIVSIHPDLFATLSPITIHLHDNKITSLPAIKLASTINMKVFAVDRNLINAIDKNLFIEFLNNPKAYFITFFDNVCASNQVRYPSDTWVLTDPAMQPCYNNWDSTTSTTTTSTTTTTTTTSSTTTLKPTPTDTCDSHRDCRFYLDHEKVYVCVLENVDLILSSIGGEHETIDQKIYTDADVKAVYFKHSILSKVPQVIFQKFPNIEFLSVAECKMTIINENTFELCGNLKTLDARKNFISRITEMSLKNCQSLETMIMTGNLELEEIESELFVVDPNLKHIVLNRRG
jgi:Leucine-rich repeat (LRR) protein